MSIHPEPCRETNKIRSGGGLFDLSVVWANQAKDAKEMIVHGPQQIPSGNPSPDA